MGKAASGRLRDIRKIIYMMHRETMAALNANATKPDSIRANTRKDGYIKI